MQNTNYFALCVCYILDAIADQHLWLHGYSWKLDVAMKQKDLHWLGGMESSSTIWDTTYIANKLTSGPNTRIPSYLSFKPCMLI